MTGTTPKAVIEMVLREIQRPGYHSSETTAETIMRCLREADFIVADTLSRTEDNLLMYMDAHALTDIDETGADTGVHLAWIQPASAESVRTVLTADENSGDGRSNWVWVRLRNGDLILGVFPQGDTYFATERDHSTPPA